MKEIFDNHKFGKFNIKSCIIRSGLWESESGPQKSLSPEIFKRYESMAKTDVGLIITELISLYTHDRFSDYSYYVHSPYFIKEFKSLTGMVHEYNVPIFAQLGFINCNVNEKQMIEVNDLSLEDIRKIQTDYVIASKKIAYAGFDGIQLNFGNNYFSSRVMDPFENQREDEFGGNTYNRVRMNFEIIQLIKKITGLHVHCRVNLYKDFDDSVEICKTLAENGADSLQITRFLSPQYFRKRLSNENMLVDFADKVSEEVSIPVVLGGGFSSSYSINKLINSTNIKFISMQRPFVRNPELLNEWKEKGYGESECKTCNNCYWKKESKCLIK